MVLESFIVGNAFFNLHIGGFPLVIEWASKSTDWLYQLFTHVNHSRQIYGNYLNSSAVRNKNKNHDVLDFGYSETGCNLQYSLPSGTLLLVLCYATRMLLDFNCYQDAYSSQKCSQLFCMFAEGNKNNATYFLQAPMWDSRILYSNAFANANDALSLMS